MNENWLILETSGRVARVGLARANAIVRSAELDSGRRHARELIPTIDAMLRAESLRPTDLTGVIASRGPGSYTGLRVGLATAKSLAYAIGCQLRTVDTSAAIAEQAPAEANQLWVITDALQNQIYLQRFSRGEDGMWCPAAEISVEVVEEWLPWAVESTWISGPGLSVYEHRVPAECPRVPEADREARVESVFAVGLRLPPLTKEELFTLEPLYLRGSSAEEKAKKEPRE